MRRPVRLTRVPQFSWPSRAPRYGKREDASWDTEADMFAAFLPEAAAMGFRAVPEACGHDLILVAGPEVSLPGVDPGDVVAVEGKLRPGVAVLRQCLPPYRRRASTPGYGRAADFYAVLVPRVDPDFEEVAAALDVGVFSMHPPWRRYGAEHPAKLARAALPESSRVIGHERLSVPDLDVDLLPGQPAPRTLSPWKIAAVRICLRGAAGAELTEADFAGTPVRRRTFLDRGWMTLSRREGRSGVYRLLERPGRPDLAYPEIARALGG